MDFYKQFLSALVSFVGLLFVVALALAVQHFLSFNIFGFTWLFVVPIGAFGMGLLCGGGFYLAGRALHFRPGWGSVLVTGALAVVAQMGLYFGDYWLADYQGTPVRELVGFAEYMTTVLGSQTMSSARGGGAPLELGKWGYALALIQFVGLLAGCILPTSALMLEPWCERCGRFMKELGKFNHYFADVQALQRACYYSAVTNEHLQVLRQDGKPHWEAKFCMESTVLGCPQCQGGRVEQTIQSQSGEGWVPMRMERPHAFDCVSGDQARAAFASVETPNAWANQ